MFDVRTKLTDPALPTWIRSLGFRDHDVSNVLAAAATVAARKDDLDAIAFMAEQLVSGIGNFQLIDDSIWSGPQAHFEAVGSGVLPMLTLLITAPEVAAFHASRGIPPEVSTATLADLGQQVWVHQLTYHEFGLHTQGWLTLAWCGALYWLGRLQFELCLEKTIADGGETREWVLSTHIPRTGPLTPTLVDESFAEATAFFARYFPDYPTRDFFCASWMLDPQIVEVLPHSNLASFQRRWTLYGDWQSGNVDVLFFVFNRREPTNPESLPRDTALQRALAKAMAAGLNWSTAKGRIHQKSISSEYSR
jgi:GNAT domain-containint protein/N-acyltransferase family protein